MAKQQLWSPPESDAAFGFPSEFPYEFETSSPTVESVAGSSSTESTENSDEEESFFAGLTQRLSQSTLNETRNKLATAPINAWNKPQATVRHSTKTRDLAGSPQSILSGIGSWSSGSSNGSPNGNSRVPSPVTAPFTDPWEVIYAAAGQVARLKMNNLVGPTHANLVQQEVKQKQESGYVWETEPDWLVHQRQLLIQNRRRELGYETGRCNVVPMSFQLHPQNQRVQQYAGSGFRVPVPGGSSVKKPSGGTGVFLPRHYDTTGTTPSASHKRTGCGPVMQPVKKVNGLNLNIGDMNVAAQQRFTNCFTNDFDLLLARRNALLKQQRLIALREEAAASCEIRLPQEWTY